MSSQYPWKPYKVVHMKFRDKDGNVVDEADYIPAGPTDWEYLNAEGAWKRMPKDGVEEFPKRISLI